MTQTRGASRTRWLVMLGTTAVALAGPDFMDARQTWLPAARLMAQTERLAPWTAIGASGTIDDSGISLFAFVNASAGYRATAATSPLEFRYNVDNVQHGVSTAGFPSITSPGWTNLELGAQAPGTSTVAAYLYRVSRGTGTQVLICVVLHSNQPPPGTDKVCKFSNTTFNFATYLYYVRVIVDRSVSSDSPLVHTLRIY